eukprot:Lithocolla_globosa_v1_NODE_4192_length_1490_cov_10.960279.p2 type:complete len:123 gc:universal NODE_4192_length_1490_cov_10.960279:489-121(-)
MAVDNESENGNQSWLQKALMYGQSLQDQYGERISEEQRAHLEETFSLLAYPDPFQSPVSSLVETQGRETVASALNSAILVEQKKPAMPPVEKIVRQMFCITNELKSQDVGAAEFIDVRADCL